MTKADFRDRARRSVAAAVHGGMKRVIEREIRQYDILHAIARSGLMSDLVFHGGTALRHCHGGERLSEDLDFCADAGFSTNKTAALTTGVQRNLTDRHGLRSNSRLFPGIAGNGGGGNRLAIDIGATWYYLVGSENHMTVKTSISLTDEQHAFVRALVETGRFGSLSAVFQQGVNLLRQRIDAEELELVALREVLARRRAGAFAGSERMDGQLTRMIAEKRRKSGVPS